MKVVMTARELMDRGLWDRARELLDLNSWAISEDLFRALDPEVTLSAEEAAKLGLLAPGIYDPAKENGR